jgi:endonuclease/exonuclease/phosphatase family metal-dependent hydrolase
MQRPYPATEKQDPVEPAAAEAAGRRSIRLASYNIHRCIGGDGRCDPGRVADVLMELGCDLIGLQEVDNTPGPAPTSLQLEYLAARTGMEAVAGLRVVRHMGHYGNALLTRFRVLTVRRHDLSLSRREPRGALDVELDVAGITTRVVVTHLGLRPGERRHQIGKIVAIVQETSAHEPLALLGDINEWLPVGRPLRRIHALLGRPPSVRSFPSPLPMLSLDRIWTRPVGSLRSVVAHRSSLARKASDHLPVVGEWLV